MEAERRLADLPRKIALLEGEVLFDGWAAKRRGGHRTPPGLVLLTNWRLVLADVDGGFCALPITKIDRVEILSPTELVVTAWYQRASLVFECAAAAACLVNLLRQDATCPATVIDLGRPTHASVPLGKPATTTGLTPALALT